MNGGCAMRLAKLSRLPGLAGAILAFLAFSAAAAGPVLIGLDAEFGHKNSTSAQAVEQGIQIAIEEINQAGGVLGGRKLELVKRDNRSVATIAVDNLRDLAKIPDLVAVMGGKFSPTYVECLATAHELQMPLLDPWGSADRITDHDYRPSYTFRLSLKDAWAAPAFIRYAKQTLKAGRIGVILPNTSWGRSNQRAIEKAALEAGIAVAGYRWYNWGDPSLLTQYNELRQAGAQALVMVANETEGALLVREIAAQPEAQRLPVVSHWGITGGEFARLAGDALPKVNLAVIQTYSFIGKNDPAARRVLAAFKRLYGIEKAEAVKSPVGVAHAYDLTHLLARAIDKAGSTDRRKIRDALEQSTPYNGLIQRYAKAFSTDRHDALSAANIFFARYTAEDVLMPIVEKARK